MVQGALYSPKLQLLPKHYYSSYSCCLEIKEKKMLIQIYKGEMKVLSLEVSASENFTDDLTVEINGIKYYKKQLEMTSTASMTDTQETNVVETLSAEPEKRRRPSK